MRTHTFLKSGNALLIAALMAGLIFSTALAGPATAQVICEDSGGVWDGGSASTGECFYPFNHALSISECGGLNDAIRYLVYNSDTQIGQGCAGLSNLQTFGFGNLTCQLWAGDFSGDATNATCTISHDYFGDCPATTVYHGVFNSYYHLFETTDFECTGGGGSSSQSGRNPGHGKYGGKIKTDESGSSHLGGNKNGSFYYDAGTCAAGCIFTPNLPGGAANSLPADVIATLYIRLAGGGNGSYSVCFDVTGIANPVIYRYISGAWVAQPISFSGGQACTTASGDGAFALGG